MYKFQPSEINEMRMQDLEFWAEGFEFINSLKDNHEG